MKNTTLPSKENINMHAVRDVKKNSVHGIGRDKMESNIFCAAQALKSCFVMLDITCYGTRRYLVEKKQYIYSSK